MPTVSLEQRLAPLAKKPAGSLLLHEIYRSVQGESMYQGLPCVFVRTAVCDLRCVRETRRSAGKSGERGSDQQERGDPGRRSATDVRAERNGG